MASLGWLALDLPDRVAPLTRVLGWASVLSPDRVPR